MLLLCSGCPQDDAEDGADDDVGTTAGTDIDAGTGGDGDVCFGEPLECDLSAAACADPGPPSPGEPVPTYEVAQSDVNIIIDDANVDNDEPEIACPSAWAVGLADEDVVGNGLDNPGSIAALVFYPTDGDGALAPNPDGFPIMVFIPGNGQETSQYEEVAQVVVRRGVIMLVIGGGQLPVGGPLRAHRQLCFAEALLDETIPAATNWVGAGHLSGELLYGGHSQGGRGSLIAARHQLQGGFSTQASNELVGVLSLAPANVGVDMTVEVGPDGPFVFVIQGSGDGDSTAAAPSVYDSVRPIEAGGQTVGATRKALVWPYHVTHSEWGGKSVCAPPAKALALMDAYIGGFIEAAVYDDPDALARFFDASQKTPLIPDSVTDAEYWSHYDGVPQVYGTAEQLVDPTADYDTWVVDRFENFDLQLSDSGLNALATFSQYAEMADGGEDAGLFNTHKTSVAVVELTPDQDNTYPDAIEWCLSCEAREALVDATTLTFRMGFERGEVGVCVGEEFPLPDIRLVIEDEEGNTAAVDVADHARLALPDTREAFDACGGATEADPCDTNSWLQSTVRVRLEALCAMGITLDSVVKLRLEFSSPNPLESGVGTIVVFDDIEIRRVPGEPSVSCRCL